MNEPTAEQVAWILETQDLLKRKPESISLAFDGSALLACDTEQDRDNMPAKLADVGSR